MLTVEYAKDPVWNDADHVTVLLTVKFEEYNEEFPFTAAPYDVMPYGVDLCNRAKAGEFGEIAPYVAPPEITQPISQGAQTL